MIIPVWSARRAGPHTSKPVAMAVASAAVGRDQEPLRVSARVKTGQVLVG